MSELEWKACDYCFLKFLIALNCDHSDDCIRVAFNIHISRPFSFYYYAPVINLEKHGVSWRSGKLLRVGFALSQS